MRTTRIAPMAASKYNWAPLIIAQTSPQEFQIMMIDSSLYLAN
jgi:hypothetical protein